MSKHIRPLTLKFYVKVIFATFVLLWSTSALQGQTKFYINDQVREIYEDIVSLKLNAALQNIKVQKSIDKDNAMYLYLENYIDFFNLFIGEEESVYRDLKKNRDTRLKILSKADKNSPYYNFCQAEILLQWAIVKMKFDERVNAANDVYKAYQLLELNKKAFPQFAENNKSLSVIIALAESLPAWLKNSLKIKGSISFGLQQIKKLSITAYKENSMFKKEIVVIYSYMLFYLNNEKKNGYQLYETYALDHKVSPLITFLKASMAQKMGLNDEALTILNERPKGSQYASFHYLDFMYGKCKLYQLSEEAYPHLSKFVKSFKGRHYIKEAYQKMAWCQLVIHKNKDGYKKDIQKCIQYGRKDTDEDKQAYQEATSKIPPDIGLLTIRLLYDGGYYDKAQLYVDNLKKTYPNKPNNYEYFYRSAKVFEAQNLTAKAISSYKKCIALSPQKAYFGCSSALQLGLIFESMSDFPNAILYYNKCLSMHPDQYSQGLHRKAKLGLNRLQTKKN